MTLPAFSKTPTGVDRVHDAPDPHDYADTETIFHDRPRLVIDDPACAHGLPPAEPCPVCEANDSHRSELRFLIGCACFALVVIVFYVLANVVVLP